MKQLLYGTTALVAAGLIVGAAAPARADDKPVTITIGGFYAIFGDVVEQNKGVVDALTGASSTVTADRGFKDLSNIDFLGRTQLDNGLKAGLKFEFAGGPSALNVTQAGSPQTNSVEEQTGEHYVWFESATYGRVELGSSPSVARKMFYGSATPAAGFQGLNSPAFIEANGWSQIDPSVFESILGTGNHTEVVNAYTPRIAGFQLGVTYAPDYCNDTSQLGNGYQCHWIGGNVPDAQHGIAKNIWEGGLNYVNKFGDVDLGVYGFIAHGSTEAVATGTTGPTQAGGGFSIGWEGWKFGAGGRYGNCGYCAGGGVGVTAGAGVLSHAATQAANIGALAATKRTDFLAGLQYTMGPWSIGPSVYWGQVKEVDANGNTAAGFGGQEYDRIFAQTLGGSYALGPGIMLVSSIEHLDYSAALGADGTTAGLATTVGSGQGFGGSHAWVYTVGTEIFF